MNKWRRGVSTDAGQVIVRVRAVGKDGCCASSHRYGHRHFEEARRIFPCLRPGPIPLRPANTGATGLCLSICRNWPRDGREIGLHRSQSGIAIFVRGASGARLRRGPTLDRLPQLT